MAEASITGFYAVGRDPFNGVMPVAKEPATEQQTVAVAGTAARSSAFNARTRYVVVKVDVATRIAFGADSVEADGTSELVFAETETWRQVADPSVTHVSVIEA